MALADNAMSSVNSFKIKKYIWPYSQRHISNLMRGSVFQITTFIEQTASWVKRFGTVVAIRKGVPHTNVHLALLVSIEATGVYILIGNNEVFLAAVYKSPSRAWNDADIMKLLPVRRKAVLADDLNAKNPFWNSAVSNFSGEKLLDLFDNNEFEISAPQSPTRYSPAGNGDVLDIVVHQNHHPINPLVCWTRLASYLKRSY